MALNTSLSFLMMKSGSPSTYSKLIDVTTTPDLLSPPELLDATTLSDTQRVNIFGIKQTDALEFEANYPDTAAEFATLQGYEGAEKDLAVWLGTDSSGNPDGHLGKFEFKGYLAFTLSSQDVNAVRKMKITVATTTEITFSAT